MRMNELNGNNILGSNHASISDDLTPDPKNEIASDITQTTLSDLYSFK